MAIKQQEIEKLLKEGFPDAEIEYKILLEMIIISQQKLGILRLRVKIEFNNIRWFITPLKEKWEMNCMLWR